MFKNRFFQFTRSYAKTVKDTRTSFKPEDSRKTFLLHAYADMMKNPIVLFVHRNNLVKTDNDVFRQQIKKAGGELNVLNNNLLKVYLRSENEDDYTSTEATKKNINNTHELFPLLLGPTAAITFKENDPLKVKEVYKVLKNAKERLFVIGARIDKNVYDLAELDRYKELPLLDGLRGQLVGVLSMLGGMGLVRVLEGGRGGLYMTLKAREEDMGSKEEQK